MTTTHPSEREDYTGSQPRKAEPSAPRRKNIDSVLIINSHIYFCTTFDTNARIGATIFCQFNLEIRKKGFGVEMFTPLSRFFQVKMFTPLSRCDCHLLGQRDTSSLLPCRRHRVHLVTVFPGYVPGNGCATPGIDPLEQKTKQPARETCRRT